MAPPDQNGPGDKKENGEFILSMLDEGVLKNSGFKRQELLPIAATSVDKDLFVMTLPNSQSPGIVLWFAGEEVDRFQSFDDYFLAMVEYGRQDIQWFKENKRGN